MTATVVLAFAVIGMVAVVGTAVAMTWWLVKKLLAKSDGERDASVEGAGQAAELKLARFETATWKREAEQSDLLADQLAEELRDALANPVLPGGSDLPAGDVRGRVLRFYDAQVGRRADRGVPAEPGPVLHPGDVEAVAERVRAAGAGEAGTADAGEP